ncbi:MAG: IclR family transcriptional regulator, partial [Verrucomicrobiota bacterium]
VERFGENVNLVVRDQAEVVYMHQVEGVHSVRMFTRLAARLPLYCTGAGKVLLIGMPKKEVIVLMGEGPYRAFTENTITTPQALYRAALQAKQLGYGVDDEERESGVRCVAAPIYDQGSKVCAALSISAPTQRLPKKQFKQVGTELIQQAEQISARLGFIKDVAGDR